MPYLLLCEDTRKLQSAMRRKAQGGARRRFTQKDSTKLSNITTRTIPSLHDQDEDNAAGTDKLDGIVHETNERDDEIQDSAATDSNDNMAPCAEKHCNRSPEDNLGHDYTFIDLLDKEICIGCNEGGKVLVCSENGCPVTFHERCLCCEPKFDTMGNFYCPYCWYKRAVAETQKLREKAMIAKKSLAKFLDIDVGTGGKPRQKDWRAMSREPKMSSLKGHGSFLDESNRHGFDGVGPQSSQIDVGPAKEKDSNEKTHGDRHRLVVGNEGHPSTSVNIASDCSHCTAEGAAVDVETVQDFSTRDKCDGPKISEPHHSQFVEEKERIKADDQGVNDENVHETTVENPLEAGTLTSEHLVEDKEINGAAALSEGTHVSIDVLEVSQDHTEYEEQMPLKAGKVPANANCCNEAAKSDAEDLPARKRSFKQRSRRRKHPQKRDLVRKLTSLNNETREKSVCDQNEDVTTFKMSGHSHVSPKQVRKLTLLNAKRKRLNWTEGEEDMLKEGVFKFSIGNQKIPWRKILEFGCNVFDVTRTPVDLKDKWRNITAKEFSQLKGQVNS
ncbi:Homeodomain-like protein with RING/FYVE/PHD-type zinc finger domain [Quillaja saponaria]|uniref:Homeodomain-like protein with RING/FYVE/PHD-type zinc finger domain n=1 Tax=Quillaja saponaria TaxID=32244 RepID=A0AAD7LUQ0_QUISA|nr:Homeodomain-like protein with RING/FYVE/PHD-type zinc finger domain [Quillaja saponaria]